MKRRGLFVAVLLAMVLPASAGARLGIRVSPAIMYEPASLTIRLSVEPDAANRSLYVAAESAEYFRSSQVELAGARAPRINVFSYRGLPAGSYEVRGRLIGDDGKARAEVTHNLMVVSVGR